MLSSVVHRRRRDALRHLIPDPVLLLGNGEQTRNLPMNKLPFRQDSTFLYFLGITVPDAVATLADGTTTVFVPPPAPDDPIWHGEAPSLAELPAIWGVDAVRPLGDLHEALRGRSWRTLAVADATRNDEASQWTGVPLRFGHEYGSGDLVAAVIQLRRTKDNEEIAELRAAAAATALAFDAVLTALRPGVDERSLRALFEAVLAGRGLTTGYQTILTVAGEILHNHHYHNVAAAGQLLLLDGGGEVESGYTVDVTRTYPVSGRFDHRQKSAYEAVLAANLDGIAAATVGTRYREVHDVACRTLATWLRDEGLLTCSVEESLESGAHAVFFPHGVGHLLGLDVHDLENFGDVPAYPPGQGRPPQFGTRYLRLDLPLQAGWVVTIEPGFYVSPAILRDQHLRDTLGGRVDWERASGWVGLGGIRIEDDVLVADEGPVVLTDNIPKDIATIHARAGSGPPPLERLC